MTAWSRRGRGNVMWEGREVSAPPLNVLRGCGEVFPVACAQLFKHVVRGERGCCTAVGASAPARPGIKEEWW